MKKALFVLIALACSGFQLLLGQNVSGTVKSSQSGEPLTGVTVTVKGTSSGTLTDGDGRYSIAVSGNNAILVFSFVGMTPQEIPVGNKTAIDVSLEMALVGIEEVVVTAYGTQKKINFTGSASTIPEAKLQRVEASNFTQGLQGAATGLLVQSTTSAPGEDATMRIRGITSVTGGNSPLIILDGTPYDGRLSLINPSDIETVTVLKDANSTALYGSRAAAGVIVVTTRKGKTGKPVFNIRSSVGISSLAVPMYKPLPLDTFFELAWEANYNDKSDEYKQAADYVGNEAQYDQMARQYAVDILTPQSFYQVPDDPSKWQSCWNTITPVGLDGKIKPDAELLFTGDWMGEIMGQGVTQDYGFDVSGGEDKLNYFFSANYLHDKGMTSVQNFNRMNMKAAMNAKVSKVFSFGVSATFSHGLSDNPLQGSRIVQTLSPMYPVYEWDWATNQYKIDQYGNRIADYGSGTRKQWGLWNPLGTGSYKNEVGKEFNTNLTDMAVSRTFVELTFTPELKFRSTLGADASLYRNHAYYSYLFDPMNTPTSKGSASKTSDFETRITNTNLLTLNKTFNGVHNLDALIGQELFYGNLWNVNSSASNMPIEGLWEVSSGSVMTGTNSFEDNDRMLSFFTKADYNYQQKYYISASLRADGSSRFNPDYRWGEFWSVGGAWRLSEESFMKSVTWIDLLKVKASYGTTGNNRVGLYEYLSAYQTGVNDFDNPGVALTRLPNDKLSWETNVQTDVGIEFGLFKRLSGSFDYFIKDAKDLLFPVNLPPSSGFPNITMNVGDVRNKGYEIELTYVVVNKGPWMWDIQANLTHFKDEITRLPEGQEEINKSLGRGAYNRWMVGGSLYDFWGPKAYGIDEETGRMTWLKNVYQVDAGGNPVLDANGKKIVTGQEKTFSYSQASPTDNHYNLGSSLPKAFGLISTNVKYKGFDLSASLSYSIGGQMFDYVFNERRMYRVGYAGGPELLDRWTPENTNTTTARLTVSNNQFGSNFSSWLLFDNTYYRLRDLTFGYTIPRKATSSIHLTNLRVYFQGSNLFSWGTSVKRHVDPDMMLSGVMTAGAGPSGYEFSTRKIITFGLQASF